MSELRRFIAGAVCPACKQIDTLFVYANGDSNVCECVQCGFSDRRERSAAPGSVEFARGLGAGEVAADEVVEIVRIVRSPKDPRT